MREGDLCGLGPCGLPPCVGTDQDVTRAGRRGQGPAVLRVLTFPGKPLPPTILNPEGLGKCVVLSCASLSPGSPCNLSQALALLLGLAKKTGKAKWILPGRPGLGGSHLLCPFPGLSVA